MAKGSVEELWDAYLNSRSQHDRNELVIHYGSLVRAVATKLSVGLPSSVDRDDLTSYGQFGLIDAIERYDPERGVKFETFAITRIRGSILDEIRALDWVPRSVRTKARQLDKASSELELSLGRPPTPTELANRLEIPLSEVSDSTSMVSSGYISSIDEHAGALTYESLGDNPEDVAMVGEVVDIVAGAVAKMPVRMRIIVALYYIEELTLAEIGEILGVTESRVCQLQGRLLHSLRESLGLGRVA